MTRGRASIAPGGIEAGVGAGCKTAPFEHSGTSPQLILLGFLERQQGKNPQMVTNWSHKT